MLGVTVCSQAPKQFNSFAQSDGCWQPCDDAIGWRPPFIELLNWRSIMASARLRRPIPVSFGTRVHGDAMVIGVAAKRWRKSTMRSEVEHPYPKPVPLSSHCESACKCKVYFCALNPHFLMCVFPLVSKLAVMNTTQRRIRKAEMHERSKWETNTVSMGLVTGPAEPDAATGKQWHPGMLQRCSMVYAATPDRTLQERTFWTSSSWCRKYTT